MDGIYLGNAVADTSVGQIIDGNIEFLRTPAFLFRFMVRGAAIRSMSEI